MNLPGAGTANAAAARKEKEKEKKKEKKDQDQNTRNAQNHNPQHKGDKDAPKMKLVATRKGFKEVIVNSASTPTDYMLAAQSLMLKMGLSLFSKRSDRVDADDALGDNTENMVYRNLDVLYKHTPTNACILVGNDRAASSISIINTNKIKTIINCTRPSHSGCLPNYHSSNPLIKYYDFPVACWNDYIIYDDRGEKVTDIREKFNKLTLFFGPMLQCIEQALRRGENVLIHCLAGAHRAGTTSIITLMHFKDLNAEQATRLAKSIRPVIDPISDFPALLHLFEQYRDNAARLNLKNVISLFGQNNSTAAAAAAAGKAPKNQGGKSATVAELEQKADALKASIDSSNRLVESLKQGRSTAEYAKRKKKADSFGSAEEKARASSVKNAYTTEAYGLAATTGEFSLIEQRRLNRMTEASRSYSYRARDRSPIVTTSDQPPPTLRRSKSEIPREEASQSAPDAAVLSSTLRKARHTYDAAPVAAGGASMLPSIGISSSAGGGVSGPPAGGYFDTPYFYQHSAVPASANRSVTPSRIGADKPAKKNSPKRRISLEPVD